MGWLADRLLNEHLTLKTARAGAWGVAVGWSLKGATKLRILMSGDGFGGHASLLSGFSIPYEHLTVVEPRPDLALLIQDRFEQHTVVSADMLDYVNNHKREFDIIALEVDDIARETMDRVYRIVACGLRGDGRLILRVPVDQKISMKALQEGYAKLVDPEEKDNRKIVLQALAHHGKAVLVRATTARMISEFIRNSQLIRDDEKVRTLAAAIREDSDPFLHDEMECWFAHDSSTYGQPLRIGFVLTSGSMCKTIRPDGKERLMRWYSFTVVRMRPGEKSGHFDVRLAKLPLHAGITASINSNDRFIDLEAAIREHYNSLREANAGSCTVSSQQFDEYDAIATSYFLNLPFTVVARMVGVTSTNFSDIVADLERNHPEPTP